MSNIYVKKYSASLIIRKMHIKTTMRYHLFLVRMAMIQKQKINIGQRKVNSHSWWECKLVSPLWRIVWRFFKN
jgi:hypothetical protein